MSDQKITVELDAKATKLVNAFKDTANETVNISQKLDAACAELEKVSAASENTAKSTKTLENGLDVANDALAETAKQAKATADGVSNELLAALPSYGRILSPTFASILRGKLYRRMFCGFQ